MYLENTNLAPAGSWRATKIESDLIWDIADALGVRQRDNSAYDLKRMVKADALLRAFIAREGRYPVNGDEVIDRIPGSFPHAVRREVGAPAPLRDRPHGADL